VYCNGSTEPSFSDIKVFRDWPGGDQNKVPSKLSYSSSWDTIAKEQWGYSMDADRRVIVLQWTKMELMNQDTAMELKKLKVLLEGHKLIETYCEKTDPYDTLALADAPLHLFKNSEDIMRDYLIRLVTRWWERTIVESRFMLENTHVDVIVTHPAVSTARVKICAIDLTLATELAE
jgi:hypothetical protein